jgi:iron complex outermembrane receptor protein
VALVNRGQIERFGGNSVLPALNSQPGIRMEERSPGSYRLNIRGSSLRAPFGVRNVKLYYNDLPYSTPGGDSYFNQLGYFDFQQVEIIKGPGSSLYGAGTGGVVLLTTESPKPEKGWSGQLSGGSFQSRSYQLKLDLGDERLRQTIRYQQQSSGGYRNHTAMNRKVLSWDGISKWNDKNLLKAHFFIGDLFYETPGALTLAEFSANPQASRPGAGSLPSAVAANASMNQKTFYAGLSHRYQYTTQLSQTTSLYGAYTRLNNPGIFNYSRAIEPHTGGRVQFQYKTNKTVLLWGAEMQQGFSNVKVAKNSGGVLDSLRTDDDILNLGWTVFAQGNWELGNSWQLTGGVSLNRLKVNVTRLYPSPVTQKNRNYDNEWAPRLALLKKWDANNSSYLSFSRGYSPPTSSEVLPSSGIIATDLEAEKGNSIELGSRGSLFEHRLFYDFSLFHFSLNNSIVVRRDALGRDFFINAGATQQQGLELAFNYRFNNQEASKLSRHVIWTSLQWYRFRYESYIKSGIDYSGKTMPSVPNVQYTVGWDLALKKGFYSNLTLTHTGSIQLNDANTEAAKPFELVALRLGWKNSHEKALLREFFLSGENITDARYCLGHDLNAAGGRYYNTAAGRGVYVGLRFQVTK